MMTNPLCEDRSRSLLVVLSTARSVNTDIVDGFSEAQIEALKNEYGILMYQLSCTAQGEFPIVTPNENTIDSLVKHLLSLSEKKNWSKSKHWASHEEQRNTAKRDSS